MSWVDEALADFGRSLGLPALDWGPAGSVRLEFERRGTLYLERLDGAVRVYLVRRLFHPGLPALRRALELCQHEQRHPFAAHAGLRGDDQLVFLTYVADADFILPTLERAMDFLQRLHEQVAQEN